MLADGANHDVDPQPAMDLGQGKVVVPALVAVCRAGEGQTRRKVRWFVAALVPLEIHCPDSIRKAVVRHRAPGHMQCGFPDTCSAGFHRCGLNAPLLPRRSQIVGSYVQPAVGLVRLVPSLSVRIVDGMSSLADQRRIVALGG